MILQKPKLGRNQEASGPWIPATRHRPSRGPSSPPHGVKGDRWVPRSTERQVSPARPAPSPCSVWSRAGGASAGLCRPLVAHAGFRPKPCFVQRDARPCPSHLELQRRSVARCYGAGPHSDHQPHIQDMSGRSLQTSQGAGEEGVARNQAGSRAPGNPCSGAWLRVGVCVRVYVWTLWVA